MKIKELEEQELRERIITKISSKLFEEASNIFYNSNEYKKWKIKHPIQAWFEGYTESKFFNIIKEIQMDLLDKEIKEAISEVDSK